MGFYFLSSVLLARASLPQQFRNGISEAVGGNLEYAFYHHWFDSIFLAAACITLAACCWNRQAITPLPASLALPLACKAVFPLPRPQPSSAMYNCLPSSSSSPFCNYRQFALPHPVLFLGNLPPLALPPNCLVSSPLPFLFLCSVRPPALPTLPSPRPH